MTYEYMLFWCIAISSLLANVKFLESRYQTGGLILTRIFQLHQCLERLLMCVYFSEV